MIFVKYLKYFLLINISDNKQNKLNLMIAEWINLNLSKVCSIEFYKKLSSECYTTIKIITIKKSHASK